MSDCNWLGMDVFGTQVLAPGPADLPSTVLSNGVSASIEQAVSVQGNGNNFVNVPMDANGDGLRVSINRIKRNRPLLVSLNLTGVAAGSAVEARIRFRTLVGGQPIATRTADLSDQLLVTSSRVDLRSASLQPRVSACFSVLVPPEVLPTSQTLEFLVQFSSDNADFSPTLTFEPKQDALVVQEIGPYSL